jgi:hypothetical protein
VTYFHVVFTLPAELRRLVRSHQTALLPVLFQAAFDSLARLCADPRFLGAQVGALAVLHTWTRNPGWEVPGWVTADLMAEYRFDFDKLALKANLTNVTNKLYADALYSGHYVPGAGRMLQVTANLKF